MSSVVTSFFIYVLHAIAGHDFSCFVHVWAWMCRDFQGKAACYEQWILICSGIRRGLTWDNTKLL